MPQRATKIVATLGPASSDPALLEQMIRAGVNVVRLNFSHGKAQDHIDRAQMVREAARRAGVEVAIMADLQGPKIRVGKFADGKVMLEDGAAFVLDAARSEPGDLDGVGLDYKDLPRDVKAGDRLLLNDGLIVLEVTRVAGEAVHTVVVIGGELSNNKGINKQGGGLTAPALTGKDMDDIKTAMGLKADYVAVSFPKTATDMELARQLCQVAAPAGHKPGLIAKIERAEAIPELENILRVSDGIMVARGDLAVEVGNAAVPSQNIASTSDIDSPASASAPRATSMWMSHTDLSGRSRPGCSLPSKARCRSTSPWISALVVIISVYSRACRLRPRQKYRQWRSVQSMQGAVQKRQGETAAVVEADKRVPAWGNQIVA